MKTWTRKQYLAGEVSHDEYFLNIAKLAGISGLTEDMQARVLASTDEHFNDVKLCFWDSYGYPHVDRAIRAALVGIDPGGVSQSDKVCVLKAVAKKWLNEKKMWER